MFKNTQTKPTESNSVLMGLFVVVLSTLSSWPASQSVHHGPGDVHCWQPNHSGGRFIGADGALLWDT